MDSGILRDGRRAQLSDKASTYVRGLIMSGGLRPGELVRPEIVGEELGISSTPAREALQALRVEGFLESVPRIGFVVAELTGQDIRDLFRVQALIAGELAALAAQCASNEDIAELDALHHEMIAAASRKNFDLLEEKNHAFHRQVNYIAGSRKILWALGLMTRYVPRQFYSTIPGWPEATAEEHAAILESIRREDPESARRSMHDHIGHSGHLLAEHFDARLAAARATKAAANDTGV